MSDEDRSDLHIAVVGMSARFAGANTPEEYWRNIRDGVECITDFSDEELRARGVPESLLRDPHYVKRAPVLDRMEYFDAPFFGLNPKEGAIMDPQQRHFLECAWEALEDAGQPPEKFEGPVGVFAGNGMHAYMMYNLISNPELMESEGLFLVRHTGNDKDFLSTRVSYALDLKGPSLTIQTACSTSLVAIHMACQSLLNGEIDMALAGGVTIELPHRVGYLYKDGEILSPDGHCRSFDANSQGTLFGSGCGVVALRRLNDALDDGDPIHSIILGSAINNDGASKVGYLAPSVDGQARCVAEALEIAEVEARSITYIETHGTGTPVGDPIEVTALQQAFGVETDETGFCGIGSVKTNIGHTDTAAGVAAVIKVAQALKNKQLPPSLNFTSPNPRIDWESGAFYVNDTLRDWDAGDYPRRAGVNSLGVGGTNAHILFEEPPEVEPSDPAARSHHLMVFSAKSGPSLDGAPAKLAQFFSDSPTTLAADVEWTLQVGRSGLPERRALVVRDGAIVDDLTRWQEGPRGTAGAEHRTAAFMFAGGGAQYPNMGRGLYDTEFAYRKAFDDCIRLLASEIDYDLKALVFPEPGKEEEAAAELKRPTRTLPSLFVTQYAQAQLWRSWGVEPSAMIGHSMGEYTAACLSGVFSLKDALAIVALRGRLFEKVDQGGMLSVQLDAEELRPRLGKLSLAAVNAPGLSLASGPISDIERLESELAAEDIKARRVHIEVAAHSSMLDPILDEFRAHFARVRFGEVGTPFVSNLTGEWANTAMVGNGDYWVRHLRETVCFAQGVARLMEREDQLLLEVGPGRTLATLSRITSGSGDDAPAVITNSLPHPDNAADSVPFMLERLGELWASGVEPDWSAFHRETRRNKLSLPTYAWNHTKLWIEPGEHAYKGEHGGVDDLGRAADRSDWFYQPTFTPAEEGGDDVPDGPIVVFSDKSALSQAVARAAEATGRKVFVVLPGTRFARLSGGTYRLRPGSATDHRAFWRDTAHSEDAPVAVIDLRPCAATGDEYDTGRKHAFDGPFHLAQSFSEHEPSRVLYVLDGGFDLAGEGGVEPFQSLALGPATVVSSEFPEVAAAAIDVRWDAAQPWQIDRTAEQVVAESLRRSSERVLAYRGGVRFAQTYIRTNIEPKAAELTSGCTLITGGLGGLGLAAAEGLARPGARLALLGRTPLPAPEEWDGYLASRDARDRTRRRIEAVRALEAAGAKVCVVAADVANAVALKKALETIRDQLGQIRGVLHTAGVLDDDLIVLKSAARADKVLQPKVAGTLALARVLEGSSLDFFVLYSSVSATLGLAGQCDYASANAYLNAFAARRSAQFGEHCVAVGWPAWQDAGMAADLAAQTFRRDGGRPVDHIFLDRCVRESPGVASYVTAFGVEAHWILGEHRVRGGGALIPGTGYLELARAALTDGSRVDSAVEMRDVAFMSPFFVGDDAPRSLRLDLRATDEGWSDFVFTSGGAELDDEEHVRGAARLLSDFGADPVRYGPIRKRCKVRVDMPGGPKSDRNLDFGARWGNLRRIDVGDGEALATLELPKEFAAELSETRMHPALLDFATAGAQMLVPGNEESADFYVPVGYLALRFAGALSDKLFSHIRLQSAPGGGELAVYDVCVFEPNGRVVLEVEEFTMRRLDDRDAFKFEPVEDVRAGSSRNDALAEGMARGVSSEDGVAILRDVLATRVPPGLIVSPVDYRELVAQASVVDVGSAMVLTIGDGDELLDDGFEAPRTELEKAIAGIWSDALGVKSIGLDSDFFKLGGHSLVAIRITSRLNQTFGVDLPLRALFEGPSVRTLAALVEELAGVYVPDGEEPDLKELARLTGDHPLVNSGEEIPVLDRSESLRPSFAQEGLWFLDQLQPGNVAYNIPMAIRLRGPLDVPALERSLSEIVARHESTRTCFISQAGQPRVEISPARPVSLAVQAAESAEAFASWSAAKPFDLAKGPLFRAELGCVDDDDHVLVLTMHHIVSDEWSLELLYQELGPLYDTWTKDSAAPSPLEELPIQYADFSAWRRDRMTAELFEEELEYWKSALEGARMTLELPADRPRPPVQTFNGARSTHEFSSETQERLHEVARQYGVTPFVTMLGAFHAFLYRLTGQDDIILGSPSSTRTRTEAENLIGFFVNTLVLRGDLSGRPTFADVLSRTRATAMDAFANSDLPFDSLVRELSVDRDPSRNPVFQVMFALFPSVREIAMSGLEVESLDVDTGGAQIDLTLYVSDGADSLRAIFEYNADLFDEQTIVGFSKCFETLLSSMLSDPDEEVDALPFISNELRGTLESFNPPETDYDRDACLHTLFEKQRKRAPKAVALEASDATWTYRELDERSNQIAGHLRQLGVRTGDYVGISSTRKSHLVSGLLGILKAGATYLPLDPAFPKERLAFMLDDTSAPVILTEAALKAELPPNRASVVCLDSDWDEIAMRATRKPAEKASPNDLAYVIYTSGSTGKPKGVQVPHGAVVNFLRSMAERPGIDASDTLLAVTTISFDISVLEIFLPISVGAKLVMVDKDVSGDGRKLAEKMRDSGASIMQATPATWRLLYQSGWGGDSSLKALCGGEALPKDLAGQLVASIGSLWNMYGPTETTIWSTVSHITDADEITIGTPIANTYCYVLDGNGCLVPPGTPGVLWIGGDGVTSGYVNRADLTADRFVSDPFRSSGARMYNTGDLVRWRRNGEIEYISRVDTQVKVRGFRIELGEIESVLSRGPGVRAAVVAAHDFGGGDVRLVGYVVPSAGAPDTVALRGTLREHLPEYMVPSLWETLDELPLTANGKVDRKALPVPGASAPSTQLEAPSTGAEKLLAEMWREILKTPEVGVRENFFDLGGHSLLAMQMIARVADATGHRFNPLEVSLQTLGQLAAALPTLDGDEGPSPREVVGADEVGEAVQAKRSPSGSDGPAPGEHRRLLKKAVRRFASRIIG